MLSKVEPSLYVQYGCGMSAPSSWQNFDSSPSLKLSRMPMVGRYFTGAVRFPINVKYGDIVRGLPVAEGVCKGLYCSHVLEHLALDDCRQALVNSRRLLAPSGIFRIVLPDLELSARKYLERNDGDAAYDFMMETGLGYCRRGRSALDLVRSAVGSSRHLWMWDYKSLRLELERAGFADIRRASFGDASDSKFAAVETEDRWRDCLGIECRMPQ